MSPKTSASSSASGKGGVGAMATPARITVAVIAILTLVFIFENTRQTKIRLLIPEVSMPLWMALLAMAVIGAFCGGYFFRRRK